MELIIRNHYFHCVYKSRQRSLSSCWPFQIGCIRPFPFVFFVFFYLLHQEDTVFIEIILGANLMFDWKSYQSPNHDIRLFLNRLTRFFGSVFVLTSLFCVQVIWKSFGCDTVCVSLALLRSTMSPKTWIEDSKHKSLFIIPFQQTKLTLRTCVNPGNSSSGSFPSNGSIAKWYKFEMFTGKNV